MSKGKDERLQSHYEGVQSCRVGSTEYRYCAAWRKITVQTPGNGFKNHLKSESIRELDDAWAELLAQAGGADPRAPEKAELLPPEQPQAKRSVGRPVNASTEIAEQLPEDGQMFPRETFESLPEIEAILKSELQEWREIEQLAAFKGLRIGVLVMKARTELKHGEFIPWCAANLPFKRVTVWRFTRAAETFLEQKRVPLNTAYAELAPKLLKGGKVDSTPVDKKATSVQLAFDFVGDRTWNELCDHLGMPKRNKVKALPAHEPQLATTPEEKAALLQKTARADWAALESALTHFVNDKLFAHLEDHEIRQLRRTLQGALSLIHEPGK